MSSDDFVKNWFDIHADSYDWKNSDLETIKKNLVDNAPSYRKKQIKAGLKGGLGEYIQDNSSKLTEWVDKKNNSYIDENTDRLSNAKTSRGLRQIYDGLKRNDDYRDDDVLTDYFNTKLKEFNKDAEIYKKRTKADLKKKAISQISRATTRGDLWDIEKDFNNQIEDYNSKVDSNVKFNNEDTRDIYGGVWNDKYREIIQEEERQEYIKSWENQEKEE